MEDQHKIDTHLSFTATPRQLSELADAMSKIGVTGRLSMAANTEAFQLSAVKNLTDEVVTEKEDAPVKKTRTSSKAGAKSSGKSSSTTSEEDEDEEAPKKAAKPADKKAAKKVVEEEPEEEEDDEEEDDFDINEEPKKITKDHLRKLTGFLSKKGHSDITDNTLEYMEAEVLDDLEKENYVTFWKRAVKKYNKAIAED